MARKRSGKFTVSGPGVEASYDDPGPALSRSLTCAERARGEVTFYVRDASGDVVGYSERDKEGVVQCFRVTPGRR